MFPSQNNKFSGPYDVINLATLFGIDFKSAKAAITLNCEVVFLKGLSRTQTFNGMLQKSNLATFDENQSLIPLPSQLVLSDKFEEQNGSKKAKL